MGGEAGRAPWRAGAFKASAAIGIAAGALAVSNPPNLVSAAETPPEIRQAERKDPAAGKIVIINRKDKANAATPTARARKSAKEKPTDDAKRAAAPDPYAPSRRELGRKPAAQTAPAAAKPTATPPPEINTAPRPANIGRDTDLETRRTVERTRAQLPSRRFDDADDDVRTRRGTRRERNDGLYPPPGYRPRWRGDRRYAGPVRRWRDDDDWSLRYRRIRRPWRICRQLAWRCRDGFERACWRWEHQCR
jgi:hypothetical protein